MEPEENKKESVDSSEEFAQSRMEILIRLIRELIRSLNEGKKVALPTMYGYQMIPVNGIIRCEANNNYTELHMANKKIILVSKNLKHCEEILTPFHFVRIHDSHLINLSHMEDYYKGDGGYVVMSDGTKVDVSRSCKGDLMGSLVRL